MEATSRFESPLQASTDLANICSFLDTMFGPFQVKFVAVEPKKCAYYSCRHELATRAKAKIDHVLTMKGDFIEFLVPQ